MQYALLLWEDSAAAERSTPDEAMAELARYERLSDELAAAGTLRGGEAFLPAHDATTVEVVDGEVRTGAVPWTERELGGFLVVACTESEAIALAARLPVATHGHVEVRPLLDLDAVTAPPGNGTT
jgi:hypothetical protein